jgi:hypothetical protein
MRWPSRRTARRWRRGPVTGRSSCGTRRRVRRGKSVELLGEYRESPSLTTRAAWTQILGIWVLTPFLLHVKRPSSSLNLPFYWRPIGSNIAVRTSSGCPMSTVAFAMTLMDHFSSLAKRPGLSPSSLSNNSTHFQDQRDWYCYESPDTSVTSRIMGKLATWFYREL